MGMPISLHVRGPRAGSAEALRVATAVFDSLREVDRDFSPHRPDNLINRFGRGELRSTEAGPLVREVVALCERARELTGGYFDAHRRTPGGGYRYDPTGLVKGWAVERAAGHLADLDGHDFCLNAGGDVLVTTVPGGRPWRVGIERPDRPSALLTAVTLAGGAVATSGTTHRGAHILDPITGTPAGALLSVTVVSESLTWADVYATAAFARGDALEPWPAGTAGGYQALQVDAAGRVSATPGWPGDVPERSAEGRHAPAGR